MKVFEVKVDWATNDAEDCTTELYNTKENAQKAFNFEKLQAMEDYGVFDEQTGELTDENWTLEQKENYWELFEEGYWSTNHCLITLNFSALLISPKSSRKPMIITSPTWKLNAAL